MNACTIISRRQLPLARALARSFLEHHPGSTFAAVVVDADDDWILGHGKGELELRLPQELPIEERQFLDMAFIYHEGELIRALKPFALRHLITVHRAPAIYLAPEVAVYAALDDLMSPGGADTVVLTPRTTAAPRDDGRAPTMVDLLREGVFDAGLVAVGAEASAFLDYWSDHLHLDCVFEPHNQTWADQRWLDPVPGMFPTDIVHDDGLQVAAWNLHARRLEPNRQIDGRPLRTFHYAGFDPSRPYLLDAGNTTAPRILLSENEALAELCDDRRRRLIDAGWYESIDDEYGLTRLDNGTPVDDRMRRVFRMALKAGEHPPVAFGPGSAGPLLKWLASPTAASTSPRPSRYLTALWFERLDLHVVFPDPDREHTDAFLAWAREYGASEAAIPDALVPPPPASNGAAAERRPGVNLAGYVRAVLGLGEAARLLLLGLEAESIPHAVVSAAGTQNAQTI